MDLEAACAALRAHAPRPLLVVDVDEVLALFVQGFDAWLRPRGHELRMHSFALFSNLYPLGAKQAAEITLARDLFAQFFSEGCHECEPAPGGAEALRRISRAAQVVVLTNAPEGARTRRGEWLKTHGLDYPLVIGSGPKGATVKRLADCAGGPAAFVDDLLSNLDSVEAEAPRIARFQMVADPALRPMAPTSARHERIDDWGALADRLIEVLR